MKPERDFWISCNMNAIDSAEFKSKTRNDRSLRENDGVTVEFLGEFMKHFGCQSIGMDLSDVNFQITKDSSSRHADEQTFRELFEMIIHSINNEQHNDLFIPNSISSSFNM